MAILQYFLTSLALAFGASTLFFVPIFLKRSPDKPPSEAWEQSWLQLSVAAGFVAGALYVYQGWPAFPPIDSTHWIFWGLFPVLALSTLSIFAPAWKRLLFGLRLLLGASFFYLIYFPLWGSGPAGWAWLSMLLSALGWSIFAKASERSALEVPGWVAVLNSQLLLAGSVVLFLAGSSALLAQLAAITSISLLPCFVYLGFKKKTKAYPLDLIYFLLSGLWIGALLFSSLKLAALLLMAALAFPLIASCCFPARLDGWRSWVLLLCLSLVWIVLSVFLAYPAGPDLYYG